MRKIAVLLSVLAGIFVFLGSVGCAGSKKYDVKFIVDGEVYKSVGTNGDDEIKLPKNPTLGDKVFEGWFVDNGTFKVEFTSTYLIENPTVKDFNVYAKFKNTHKHYYEINYVKKTCTTGGYKEFKCSCGNTYQAEHELALGHALGLYKEVKSATCISDGSEIAVCLREGCNHSVTRVIPKSNKLHSYNEENKCTYCGDTLE